jgi:hypothetical protein
MSQEVKDYRKLLKLAIKLAKENGLDYIKLGDIELRFHPNAAHLSKVTPSVPSYTMNDVLAKLPTPELVPIDEDLLYASAE